MTTESSGNSQGLLASAERFARRAHEGQFRKGDPSAPYVVHPASVAQRLARAGVRDETTLASAWLHDVIEDCPDFAAALRAEFPADVVATVEVLTERKLDAQGRKRPKSDRFDDYVRALAVDTPAARRARVVSCADKLDNVLDLLAAESAGRNLLSSLNTRPGQHRAQLTALRSVYDGTVEPALLTAYDLAAHQLFEYIERWLPGRAAAIAAAAHLGQFDKSGAPYILHPMRLMTRAESRSEQCVAALHDVLEDTNWTLAALQSEGFGPEVLAAVDCLTRREGESYDAFIERIAGNPLATRVKLLDLEDNLNLLRLDHVGKSEMERAQRYHRARRRLRETRDRKSRG